MTRYPSSETSYTFGSVTVVLPLPDAAAVQTDYLMRQTSSPAAFPYWSKVWPAAIGLCRFLAANPAYVSGRQVLELAAGLGLPSLLAARWASQVVCSDLEPAATHFAAQAAVLNGLTNFRAETIDWSQVPPELKPEVLLLSDINYDPETFEQLFGVLIHFLKNGCTIILSTPQRLAAKPFIERLLSYCTLSATEMIAEQGDATFVSVYVLAYEQKL